MNIYSVRIRQGSAIHPDMKEEILEISMEDGIWERLSLIEKLMPIIRDSLRSGHFEEVSSMLEELFPLLELPPDDKTFDLINYAYSIYVEALKGLKELLDGSIGVQDFKKKLSIAELFCEWSIDSIEKTSRK